MEKLARQSRSPREINQNFRESDFCSNGALTRQMRVHVLPVPIGSKVSLPGSSVAEQVTVNHLVVGSIPTRAAN